jgi:hypothetical protein
MIEVEIDGVTVRVGHDADAKTVMALLRALRAGAAPTGAVRVMVATSLSTSARVCRGIGSAGA